MKLRDRIFQKYGGRCAYCGCELQKGWHVDHITPKVYQGTNEIENLNPACKYCNNYKCHSKLETFRTYTKQMLNEKLEYLFKSKTKMQVAINMGAIKHQEWDGVFYFEKLNSDMQTNGASQEKPNSKENDG